MNDGSSGVVVLGYQGNTQSLNLGLMRGDILLEVNGKKITSTQTLEAAMNTPSKNWQIAYLRDGNIMTLSVRLP